jgi:hypothetical protein
MVKLGRTGSTSVSSAPAFRHNVDSIVLEVPTDMLGGPVIGVWASISRYRDDGTLEQLDRGGNPTINPFINPDGQKNLFNSRQPEFPYLGVPNPSKSSS